jgi:hypothetical protein
MNFYKKFFCAQNQSCSNQPPCDPPEPFVPRPPPGPRLYHLFPEDCWNPKPVLNKGGNVRALFCIYKSEGEPGMVVYTCNPSSQEAVAGGLPVPCQPGLHSENLSSKTKILSKGGRAIYCLVFYMN